MKESNPQFFLLRNRQNGAFLLLICVYIKRCIPAEKFCFRNLSFELASSQTLAILGLNGQGKSTLMSCMMGILQPKEGEIVRKAKFAFLPQSFNVAFDYSVLDIVLMGRVREISLFSKPGKRIFKSALTLWIR